MRSGGARRVWAAAACAASIGVAEADPRVLPFTYGIDTVPPGDIELMLNADLVPLRAIADTGQEQSYLASAYQLEAGIGLLDRLDLAFAASLVPQSSHYANQARFEDAGNGLRQRARYLLADPGAWPVDVGVVAELTQNERAFEAELRVVAAYGFDRVGFVANAGIQHDWRYDGQRAFVLSPSLGAAYEITPRVLVGIEGWLRATYPRAPAPPVRTFSLGPQVYAGPTIALTFGKLWWSAGGYARVTDHAHDLEPTEPFGRVWVRTAIGLDL
jgi:hypothetical protein